MKVPTGQFVHALLSVDPLYLPKMQAKQTVEKVPSDLPNPVAQTHEDWAPLEEVKPYETPSDAYPTVALQKVHAEMEVWAIRVLLIQEPMGQEVHAEFE